MLDENPVVQEVEQGQQPTFDQAQLTNVTFTYPDTVNPVIQKLNLTIPKGQIMGIHAPSGTGKSTILKLLAHFYDPDTGQVTINKTSLTKINSNYLRQMESYVSQETWLFQDTIANNLKLGNPQASDQEIQLVAQQAGIANYIESLPEQYQTKLSELADSISEGQKQRLGIARAFLHEGELLLLDEITANLDVLNEAIILKSLQKIAKEKTVVIVSHRLSTLSIADQIYELTL
ncbi:ATP-binding cassette domain-containing protein [Limosilactobacillus gastricus]|uniref:ATP-binding cassette domain-containing protein n=1 Tax=Limosilactobacillus gastricus TaxID=227942 RepID=UPI00129983A4|nr:ABC transporter ATP-binding protein [Limosilactobacillus gastricus]QGF40525.1 ATP-binding cassette domain-containing protein [Limosilactobacillus gastricus]